MSSFYVVESRGKRILDMVSKPKSEPDILTDPVEARTMSTAIDEVQPPDEHIEDNIPDPTGSISFAVDIQLENIPIVDIASTAIDEVQPPDEHIEDILSDPVEARTMSTATDEVQPPDEHIEGNIPDPMGSISFAVDIPIVFDVDVIDGDHVEVEQIEVHDDILDNDLFSSHLEPENSIQNTNSPNLTVANASASLQELSDNDSDYSPSIISDSDDSYEKQSIFLRKRKRVVNDSLSDCSDPESANNGDGPKKMKHARQHRKNSRNTGKSYITEKGRKVPARVSAPLRNSCRKKCGDRISEDLQMAIFTSYWNLGSYDKRVIHICSRIRIVETATARKKDPLKNHRNRMHTIKYSVVCDGDDVDVCYCCFKSIYGETEKFLKTVIGKKKSSLSGIPIADQRGKSTPKNKTSNEVLEKIKEHIKSYPSYESHYTRRDTSKKYLPSDLTIAHMHREFVDKYKTKISIAVYTTVFKTFNLSFKKPKLDTCHKCDIFKAKSEVATTEEEKQSIKNDHNVHLESADYAYKMKSIDKEKSMADLSVKTYAFDLEQCLPTPHLESNVAFYKRQLYTLNLTIHDCQSSIASCYIWHEGIAARGGNEIASCLYQHLKNIPEHVKQLIFYSDTCPGQNRNSHVASMFMTFMAQSENIEVIDHKFLVPGHTHMECDSDHALIERTKKRTHLKIHHPHDWAQMISNVGKGKKFEVHELTKENFFDFSKLLRGPLILKKIDTENRKFSWNSVQWLRYTKEPGVFLYKYDLKEDTPFSKMNFRRRGQKSNNFSSYLVPTEEVFISKEKKSDVISLLPLINPLFHQFYKDLKTANEARDMLPEVEYDSE